MDRISFKGQMIDQVDLSKVPHSGFDRSNHNYFTGRLGSIIPTRSDEVYPGDRFQGRPTIVANFEPLAAPLYGSLVLKQESFFVPLIQLWRHSYKFFTGKNGFNEDMPSISPRDVLLAYQFVHEKVWSNIGEEEHLGYMSYLIDGLNHFYASNDTGALIADFLPSGMTLDEVMASIITDIETVLRATYQSRKMYDLVLPILKHFKKYASSDEFANLVNLLDNVSDNISERRHVIIDFTKTLGDLMLDWINFFHGPSSIFDYLGWPIPKLNTDVLTQEEKQYKFGGYAYADNAVQFWLLRNVVLSYGITTIWEHVADQFSEVPLNFGIFKAYYLVWYWNYRDQLLETGILDPEEDEFLGSEITTNVILYTTMLRQRCWFKDAFTTALTNTGDGNLLVPLAGTDDLSPAAVTYYDNEGNLVNTSDHSQAINAGATFCAVRNGSIEYNIPMNYLTGAQAGEYSSTDLRSSSAISLDLFDRIKRLRTFVQKRLVLGYEVDDVIYSSFLVKMSNVRMHIPEILSQGRDAVEISTIINNTTTQQQVAGDKTATAWVKSASSEQNYFAEEWGFYISIATILPIQSYCRKTDRMFLRKSPFDYMWPEFATMGMDAIYNCELASIGSQLSDADALAVFGYNGRYNDLKYKQDEEHGRFLTDLNYLTFSREFDSNNLPKLNYMFVHCWPRLDGFVLESEIDDVFRADCYTAHGWERRLPVPSEYVG